MPLELRAHHIPFRQTEQAGLLPVSSYGDHSGLDSCVDSLLARSRNCASFTLLLSETHVRVLT